MQYAATTPEEYMAVQAIDWRLDWLKNIQQLIWQAGPDLVESINYKMLCYSDEQGPVFHLNSQKSYVGLYVGDIAKIDTDGSLLKGLNIGKGCIRFTKTVNPNDTNIAMFIEQALKVRLNGGDTEC